MEILYIAVPGVPGRTSKRSVKMDRVKEEVRDESPFLVCLCDLKTIEEFM